MMNRSYGWLWVTKCVSGQIPSTLGSGWLVEDESESCGYLRVIKCVSGQILSTLAGGLMMNLKLWVKMGYKMCH